MEKYKKVLEFAVYNTNRNIIKKEMHKSNADNLFKNWLCRGLKEHKIPQDNYLLGCVTFNLKLNRFDDTIEEVKIQTIKPWIGRGIKDQIEDLTKILKEMDYTQHKASILDELIDLSWLSKVNFDTLVK